MVMVDKEASSLTVKGCIGGQLALASGEGGLKAGLPAWRHCVDKATIVLGQSEKDVERNGEGAMEEEAHVCSCC